MSICLSGTACSFGEAKQHSKDLPDKASEKKPITQDKNQTKKTKAQLYDDVYETTSKKYTSVFDIDPLADDVNYFVSNDLFLNASNASMYQRKEKLLIELSLEEPPEEIASLAVLTADEPVVIKKVRTISDNEEEYRKVFSNNFKISFLSKNKEKPLNINFSNNEYITTYPTYIDENISIIYVETKGISLRPEYYSWSSCLYLYHKKSNKIMDFSPEGCVWQDIKRTGVTKKNDYERDEVYLNEVKVKNGIYTISFNNVPRLQNSQVDFSKEKTLTYKFKSNLENDGSQFQLVDCDYRYKKSNKLIKEHRECDYSLD